MTKYICGVNAVREAIERKIKITKLIVINKNEPLILVAKKHNIPISIVNKDFFAAQFASINHQNICVEVAAFEYADQEATMKMLQLGQSGLVLILDSIEDPANFGAILRTSEAFAVDAVFIKKDNQAQVNDTVLKTSLGAAYYQKIVRVSNINEVIEKLKKINFWVIGSSLDTKNNVSTFNFDKKTAIVVGNENSGISKLTLSKCDEIVKISMQGKIQSLNVSVATGIILHEVRRRG